MLEIEPVGSTLDVTSHWSLVKPEIVRRYAAAYVGMLEKRPRLRHIYIEVVAGDAMAARPAAPYAAPGLAPGFFEYHLVNAGCGPQSNRGTLFTYEGDPGELLLEKIFPRARWNDCRRALCLVEPGGPRLSWDVIATAGRMKSIEMFLSLPAPGDDSGPGSRVGSDPPEAARDFGRRLKDVACFPHVTDPMPLRNAEDRVTHYLFFASPNSIGARIAREIFSEYGQRREGHVQIHPFRDVGG